MALITPNQFLLVVDERVVRQNLSDTNAPVTGDLTANAILLELLLQSEGEVLSAASVGERYSQTQLETLAASSTAAAGALLRRLCADIGFALLMARRGRYAADVDRLCPRYSAARQMLEQLRLGARVFPGITEAEEAGTPSLAGVNPTLIPNRPHLLSSKAQRIFPFDCVRNNPPNTGCC